MLFDRSGQTIAEWIVIVLCGVALVGGAIYAVFVSLAEKFNEINTRIGS